MASHQQINGLYIKRDSQQIITGNTEKNELHFVQPALSTVYTFSDVKQSGSFFMSNCIDTQTISNQFILQNATLYNVYTKDIIIVNNTFNEQTISGYIKNPTIDTISNGFLQHNLFHQPIFCDTTHNESTLLGGTISDVTLLSANNIHTLSNGTLTSTIINPTVIGTLSNLTSNTIYNQNTVNNGVLNSCFIISPITCNNIYYESLSGTLRHTTLLHSIINSGTIKGGKLYNVNNVTVGNLFTNSAKLALSQSGQNVNTGWGHMLIDNYATNGQGSILTLRNSAGGTNAFSGLLFEVDGSTSTATGTITTPNNLNNSNAMIYSLNKGSSNGSTFGCQIQSNGDNVEMLTILGEGQKVGINNTSPQTTLDISGSVQVQGGTLTSLTMTNNSNLLLTLTHSTLTKDIINLNTITNGSISNNHSKDATLTNTTNRNTISNGTMSNTIISGGSILSDVNILANTTNQVTIQNSLLYGETFTDTNYNLGNIEYGTISETIMASGTIYADVQMSNASSSFNLAHSNITESSLSGDTQNVGILSFGTMTYVNINTLTGGVINDEFSNLKSILTNRSFFYVFPSSFTIPTMLYGSYNVYSDIQSAITACNSAGGGTVFITKGTYSVSGQLTLSSNITIKGSGMGSTVLDCTSMTNGYSLLNGSNINNVRCEQFQIYSSSTSNVVHPLTFVNCSYVTIDNINFNYTQIASGLSQPNISFSGSSIYYSCNVLNSVISAVNIKFSGNFKRCYLTQNVICQNSSASDELSYVLQFITTGNSSSDPSEIAIINNNCTTTAGGRFMLLSNTTSTGNLYSAIHMTLQANAFSILSNYLMVWLSNQTLNIDKNSRFIFSENSFNFQYLFRDISTAWCDGGYYQIANNVCSNANTPGLWWNDTTSLPNNSGNSFTIYLDVFNNTPAFSLQSAYYNSNGTPTVYTTFANAGQINVKSQYNQIIVSPMSTISGGASWDDTSLTSYNIHFQNPTASRLYTMSDVGLSTNMLLNNSTNGQTLSNQCVLQGTIIGSSTLTGIINNSNAITSGVEMNTFVENGVNVSSVTNVGTLLSGSISSTLESNNVLYGTMSDGTFSGNVLFTNGLTGGVISSAITNQLSLSGVITNNDTMTCNIMNLNLLTNNVLYGTISNGYVSNNITLLNTISNGTLTNNVYSNVNLCNVLNLNGTLSAGSLSGNVLNQNTISNGTISSNTSKIYLVGTILNSGSITNGLNDVNTVTDANYISGTISGGTMSENNILNDTFILNQNLHTISGGNFTGSIQNDVSIVGTSYVNGGNMGINTASPSSTVHVSGTFQATSGTLGTAVINGDPIGTASSFSGGKCGQFRFSSLSSNILYWDSSAFYSDGVTYNGDGSFTFRDVGIYHVFVNLFPDGTYSNSRVHIGMDSSSDNLTYTNQYTHYQSGSLHGTSTWNNTITLNAKFMINVTSSSQYWRITSTSVFSFTTTDYSNVAIYSYGTSEYGIFNSSLSMNVNTTSSNTLWQFGISDKSSNILLNASVFQILKPGIYDVTLNVVFRDTVTTSTNFNCIVMGSTDNTTYYTVSVSLIGRASQVSNETFYTSMVWNSFSYQYFKVFYFFSASSAPYDRDLSPALSLTQLRINETNNSQFYLSQYFMHSTHTTRLLSLEKIWGANDILYDNSNNNGIIYVRNGGIYAISAQTTLSQSSLSCSLSSDGVSWSNGFAVTFGSNLQANAVMMLSITSNSFFRLCHSSSMLGRLPYGFVSISKLTDSTFNNKNDNLLLQNLYTNTIKKVICETDLIKYFTVGYNPVNPNDTITVNSYPSSTWGLSRKPYTGYTLFKYGPFYLQNTCGNSIVTFDLDGSIFINTPVATLTNNAFTFIILEYSNSVATKFRRKICAYNNVNGGGCRGTSMLPFHASFHNLGNPLLPQTLSCYIGYETSGNAIYLQAKVDASALNSWNLKITEIQI